MKSKELVLNTGEKEAPRRGVLQLWGDYLKNLTRDPKEGAREVLHGGAILLCTMLLGRGQLPFAVYPFGIAFFAAQSKRVLWSFVGLLLSSLFTQNLGIATVISSVTMLLLRYCLCHVKDEKGQACALFCEPFLMRLLVALCGAMLLSWYRILFGGFRAYDFSGAFLLLVLCGFACAAFSCADGALRFRYAKEIGALSVGAALVFVLRYDLWLGMSPAAVLAWTCTLFCGYRQGGAKGCVCGMACGMAASVAHAPAYAIGGLLFGVLHSLNTALAIAWCAAGAGVYLLFADSLISVYSALPDFVMAVGITLLLHRLVPTQIALEKAASVADLASKARSREKIEDLSRALADLSKTFSHLSTRLRKPGVYEVRLACDAAMRPICVNCPERIECSAGKPSAYLQTLEEVAVQMTEKGTMESHLAPKPLLHHCAQLRCVVDALNKAYARLRKESMEENATEVVADDYAAMSGLLAQALRDDENEYALDAVRTEAACRQAKKIGFCANEMAVVGNRRVQILANDVEEASVTAEKLQKTMEKTLGLPFHPPAFSVLGEGQVQMKMTRRPILCASASHAACTKAGEEVSGDVISSFTTKEDMFYTLLSDGMGSGPDAAVSAGICRVFLEKMLCSGNTRSISMEMLNDLIRNKNNENFATVDLLEVDLLCKEARFLKSGAAPSFVLRGGNLFKIAANTAPVGVMRALQAEEIKFRLEDNDVILMFSDGIAQSFEDSLWLLGVVTCEWEDDLDKMAQKILSRAKTQHGAIDDMTIALIRIQSLEEAKIPA